MSRDRKHVSDTDLNIDQRENMLALREDENFNAPHSGTSSS